MRTAQAVAVALAVAGSAATHHPPARADVPPARRPAIEAAADPRMVTVRYAPDRVVRVPVRRGQVTHIVLPEDEQLQGGIATGQGADCSDPVHAWCVTGTGRDLFVKPRAGATRNTLALVGSRRRHSFELVLAADDEPAALRVSVLPPESAVRLQPHAPALHAAIVPTNPADAVAGRLRHQPTVANSAYSIATGAGSDDIVPRLVFDDGHHTHFRFAPGQPLPAVFEQRIDPEEPEQMVNLRVEDDRLVADRVARGFVLRLGRAVVSVVNEGFAAAGVQPPAGAPDRRPDGTLAPGVRRVLVVASTTTAHRVGPTAPDSALESTIGTTLDKGVDQVTAEADR